MSPRRHILDDVDAIVPDDKHRNEHVISIDCPDCANDDDKAEAEGLPVTKPHGRRTAIDGACSKCCNRSWSPAGGMTVADRIRIKSARPISRATDEPEVIR